MLPHISVSRPSTDLCFVCQKNNLAIQESSCLSDEAKAERLVTAQEHLSLAHKEREYYKSQVKVAFSALESCDEADKLYISHYSYEFAQQVHFSFSAKQTGPEYFKTARKCGIFGVCNDGDNTQVTYLIDEAENPGKGAHRYRSDPTSFLLKGNQRGTKKGRTDGWWGSTFQDQVGEGGVGG